VTACMGLQGHSDLLVAGTGKLLRCLWQAIPGDRQATKSGEPLEIMPQHLPGTAVYEPASPVLQPDACCRSRQEHAGGGSAVPPGSAQFVLSQRHARCSSNGLQPDERLASISYLRCFIQEAPPCKRQTMHTGRVWNRTYISLCKPMHTWLQRL
jgi:hypothetical protein